MRVIVHLFNFLKAVFMPALMETGLHWPTTMELTRFWVTLAPASCMPTNCFCEPVLHGWIRQPINTWSNLAFIFAGGLVALVAIQDFYDDARNHRDANLMRSQWIYPAVYAYTAVLVGIGSILYHGTLSFYGQVVDILGMYLLSTFMALYNLSRLFKFRGRTFFGLYVVANLVLGIISTQWPELRRLIFVGVLGVILISEVLVRKVIVPEMSKKLFWAALISLVMGCAAWILDVNHLLCLPNSWLQLHSVWHIGMAAAIGFLYLYYRSETPKKELRP